MMSRAAIGCHLLGASLAGTRDSREVDWQQRGPACVAPDPAGDPGVRRPFPVRWAGEPTRRRRPVRTVLDRGRHRGWHRETMAPQNLGTFCLLLLYLIGAVIAG